LTRQKKKEEKTRIEQRRSLDKEEKEDRYSTLHIEGNGILKA